MTEGLGALQGEGRRQIEYVERKKSSEITKVDFALVSNTISEGLIK